MAAVQPYMLEPDSGTETEAEQVEPPSQARLEQDILCKSNTMFLLFNFSKSQ